MKIKFVIRWQWRNVRPAIVHKWRKLKFVYVLIRLTLTMKVRKKCKTGMYFFWSNNRTKMFCAMSIQVHRWWYYESIEYCSGSLILVLIPNTFIQGVERFSKECHITFSTIHFRFDSFLSIHFVKFIWSCVQSKSRFPIHSALKLNL